MHSNVVDKNVKKYIRFLLDGSWAPDHCFDPDVNRSGIQFHESPAYTIFNVTHENNTVTPVEAYWK